MATCSLGSETEIGEPCSCTRHFDLGNVDDAYKSLSLSTRQHVRRISGLDLAPISIQIRSRWLPRRSSRGAPNSPTHHDARTIAVMLQAPPPPVACRTPPTLAACALHISILLPVSRTTAVSERQARKRPGPPTLPSPPTCRSLCICRCIRGSEGDRAFNTAFDNRHSIGRRTPGVHGDEVVYAQRHTCLNGS